MAHPKIDAALEAFRSTLDSDVKSLIELYEKDNVGKGRPGRWLEAITRSAIVLLTANLENYIETLFCEGIGVLVDKKLPARRYPENFRLWIFRQEIHMRSLGLADAKAVTELSMKLWSDVRELQTAELRIDKLKDDFANPTAANIEWLISLLDKEAYLDGLVITVDGTNTAASAALGELAQRRNEIAHGNVAQKPSIDDVKRLAKFGQLFGNRIKRDVELMVDECLKRK